VAVAALLAVIVVAAILLIGGDTYTVRAEFDTASQLVNGNRVQVGGEQVGSVEKIELTDNGRAEVTFTVGSDYVPLRRGTRAVVRIQSLSGVANRYIDLHLGPDGAEEIEDGGLLTTQETTSATDLDQFFNLFDDDTRKGASKTIKLFSEFSAGDAEEGQEALRYLNPALATSSRLFDQLSANDTRLERFVVETSRLVTDLGSRDEALASLVSDLAATTDALASRRTELGTAVRLLPPFMRRANTTFVNLRSTLDDLDPLVTEAGPLVRNELPALMSELRPLAADAVPTVRDLRRTIRRPGSRNDLVELLRLQPRLARIATRSARRNGEVRPGAFRAIRDAARGVAPQIAFLRPYAPDMMGWFDDFSRSGMYDALGGFSRAGTQLNAFSLTPGLGGLAPVPPELRDIASASNLAIGRNNRCPGSSNPPADDGSNPYIPPNIEGNCDPSHQVGTLP
jgi:phospholipid/cholesterol/gamma-HCH transport system substrate-binding protein